MSEPVEVLKQSLADRKLPEAMAKWTNVPVSHPRFEGARLLLAESLLEFKPDFSLSLLKDAVAYNPKSFKAARLLAKAYAKASQKR